MNKTVRDASRGDYTTKDVVPSWQEVRDGALLRIADAIEKMARQHTDLIDQRDKYKYWYDQEMQRRSFAERRISALRGIITRMKNARKTKPPEAAH